MEVWLYGSAARGDCDDVSDVDLLVLSDSDENVGLPVMDFAGPVSVSHYTWAEVEAMVGYGSLFLHHVKEEGRPLVEEDPPRLRELLGRLPSYTRAAQELDSFEQVVADVRTAVKGDHSSQFELAVLATAARHAAILGCYLIGTPRFGRREPFDLLLPQLGYGAAEIAAFERLYSYRVAENRDEVAEIDRRDDAPSWVPRVDTLIRKVRELAL
jgi:hypothetical protein